MGTETTSSTTTYEDTTTDYSTITYYPPTDPTYTECGGTITSYETISSPFYPSYYPNHARCVWNIELGDDVVGFNIVRKSFSVEKHTYCAWDWLRLEANDYEVNFCGGEDNRFRGEAKDEKKEDGKYTPNQVNPRPTGFPKNWLIAGSSAVITFQTDGSVYDTGFEFELVKMTRSQIIGHHAQRVMDSVADEKWGTRYSERMHKILDKMDDADTGVSCYDENFPSVAGDEGDEVTVFDADDMCKLNGQVNAAMLAKDEARSTDKSSVLREKSRSSSMKRTPAKFNWFFNRVLGHQNEKFLPNLYFCSSINN